ncbi:hypothetical protein GN330_14040 [Nitratireductor sp. CAU 1489]|uniref:Lipoprotein n=1 Tax=Nitratireductor arenosus TaxID=2682096 RepID=A0A844QEG6_9HYPH|nr:hypothetical protein [Nitratireductor arenosus]MVA98366.1 hypothetical protein [Nitratireductor arenosus]
MSNVAKRSSHAVMLAAVAAIAGCTQTAPPDDQPALRSGSAEDERACLAAVAGQTGNTVSVLSSEFSEAATLVMVGVGPDRAPWRCLISGGVVTEVMSTVDEGAL